MAACDIPDYEFENLARSFLPAMQKYFASEEGMAAYEKWLSEQEDETFETKYFKTLLLLLHVSEQEDETFETEEAKAA